jgi:hypothetical protein
MTLQAENMAKMQSDIDKMIIDNRYKKVEESKYFKKDYEKMPLNINSQV